MAWREVEVALRDETATRSGRAIRGQHETGDGATFAALRLYGLEDIDEAWQRVPTLNLDATADMTLLRARVPHAELVASVEASAPHMKVFSVAVAIDISAKSRCTMSGHSAGRGIGSAPMPAVAAAIGWWC